MILQIGRFIFICFSHCYATVLRQYCHLVRQETKDIVGPMFKVVNRSTGKMTQSTLGLASMKYISVEVATMIGLMNPHLYTSKFLITEILYFIHDYVQSQTSLFNLIHIIFSCFLFHFRLQFSQVCNFSSTQCRSHTFLYQEPF